MSYHTVAKSYGQNDKGRWEVDFICPCCKKIHTVETPKQLENYMYGQTFCYDSDIVVWLMYEGKLLAANRLCSICEGENKEVLFQFPEPCSKCNVEKIPINTLESWYIQQVGCC